MKVFDPFKTNFSGINLIEASAGTGKTYNIASLYVLAIVEQQRTVDQILVVTYTEAATQELRDRLIKRLREAVLALEGEEVKKDEFLRQLVEQISDKEAGIEKLYRAIRSFDDAAVYTIHGFCQHVLQSRAFESRALFDAKLLTDDSEITGELIDDYWRNWVKQRTNDITQKPLLKFLLDRGYTPGKLRKLLIKHTGKPYLKLIPQERPVLEDITTQLKSLSIIYDDLKKEWEGEQDNILHLLTNKPMHGNKYRKNSVPQWIQEMDDWLQSEVPSVALAEKFTKFRQSTINKSLTKSSNKPPPVHPFFEFADSYAEAVESLSNFDIYFKLKLFDYLQQHTAGKKEQLQVFSFDDLLINLNEALEDGKTGTRLRKMVRQTYPVAMVDEFQDTDPIQYQIFNRIYGSKQEADENSALYMIGDPKQSVYSFRGADIFTYLQAKNSADEEKIFSLKRNFRSVPPFIEAVNALFGFSEKPFILSEIPFKEVEAGRKHDNRLKVEGHIATPIKIRNLELSSDKLPLNKGDAQDRSAEDTACQIHHLLNQAQKGEAPMGDQKVEAGDIAVLVRSHYQADLISDALKEKKIKSVHYSRKSVFKTDEAEELQYILKAVVDAGSERLIKAALTTNALGYKAKDLLQFEENEQRWMATLEQFANWNESWQRHGIAYMFRQMTKDGNIAENIIRLKYGERKLTNFMHLTELLQQREQEGKTGLRKLLHWLQVKRNEDNNEPDEEQLRLESDENLVKVVTMHRSKGLEYPIVFCPFLWKGPKLQDGGEPLMYHKRSSVYLDFNGKDDPERNRKRVQREIEQVAESIRLAYVAVTRARHQCVISWAQARKSEFSPLGYLLLGSDISLAALKDDVADGSKYAPVKPALFEEAFENLFSKYPELFSREYASDTQTPALSCEDVQEQWLENRTFNRMAPLDEGFAISSFSSLVRSEHENYGIDFPDYFDDAPEAPVQPADDSFFSFPKGSNPGTAIHHIFENVDFKQSKEWESIIADHLSMQSIDERWIKSVKEMLRLTLKKPLQKEPSILKMKDINPDEKIVEMEFYFSSGEADLKTLLRIIRPAAPSAAHGFADEGYLKGFIDLTFKHNGRYYILDYKTNHLGYSISDYKPQNLEEEMRASFYDLQYHIYAAALHRFLTNKVENYSYENHFGGVFYLFLRGINEKGSEGIYFARPDRSIIKKLNSYLQRK